METIRLGRTNLLVSKNGFGALPVQRVGMEDACRLLRKASPYYKPIILIFTSFIIRHFVQNPEIVPVFTKL